MLEYRQKYKVFESGGRKWLNHKTSFHKWGEYCLFLKRYLRFGLVEKEKHHRKSITACKSTLRDEKAFLIWRMVTTLRDWSAEYVREKEKIWSSNDNKIGVYKILWIPSPSWWGATECCIYHETNDAKASGPFICIGFFKTLGRSPARWPSSNALENFEKQVLYFTETFLNGIIFRLHKTWICPWHDPWLRKLSLTTRGRMKWRGRAWLETLAKV